MKEAMNHVKELVYQLDIEVDKERKSSNKVEKVLKSISHSNMKKIRSITTDLIIGMMKLKDEMKKKEEEHNKEVERLQEELKAFRLIAFTATDWDEKAIYPMSVEKATELAQKARKIAQNEGTFVQFDIKEDKSWIDGVKIKIKPATDGVLFWR